jgi:predicted secreted protein
MKYLLKLFLTFLIFAHQLLFADGEDIGIRVNNALAVTENAGSTSFDITLTEAPDWCDEVVVTYNTQDDSAQAGSDYTAKSGSVTFYGACLIPPRFASATTETISVDILDDTNYESNEMFYLTISNSMLGYNVTDYSGSALIYDDDTMPLTITPYSTTVSENDGTAQATFTVQLNQPAPSGGVTVSYNTYDGSAKAGDDYTQQSSSLSIPAGQTTGYIQVAILGDTIEESQENFSMDFFSPSQGTLTRTTVTGTINDDDRVNVDITSSDVLEGNVGDNNKMEFKIFLTKDYPLATPLTINYQTQDGSSPSATAGSDYTAMSGSVTFNLGDREKIVQVPIIGDDVPEHDENLKMLISGSPYIIDSDSESEILNDDGAFPGVNFATGDFSILEGNSSTKTLNFNFTLDKDALPNTSFDYHTQDDEATVADNDYVQINTTTYHIPAGTRDINIPVTINGDTNIENDELFELKITNEKNINVLGHTAKGNILNDDGSLPEISFDLPNYSVSEGDSGTHDINFTISLSQPALAGSSFQYKTQHGSAKASQNDYVEINPTTHIFSGGETTLTIPVTVIGDTNVEGDEEFYVRILNGNDVEIAGSQISATAGILNDDVPPDTIKNIGEFRFDDCGNEEWKIDHSSVANHITSGAPSVITNDGKPYMCTSLNGNGGAVATVAHHSKYALDKGTISMLLYDHHNVWSSNSWMFQKGSFKVEVVRVAGDANKGSLKVYLDGNIIDTQEVFFTNSDGGDLDTQWIHVAVTFGNRGLKLYVNGIEKGSHAHTGGIASINDNFTLASLSGYYDEFYIFEGQMNGIQVDSLYNNTINDKNIDGTARDCGCYTSSDPFTCDSSMYISSSTNRETSATGRMWLHRVDTTQNPFEFEVMEDTGASELYNATAYNPDDNYIYGLYHRELVRLSRGAEVTNLGTITGLHTRFDSKQLYAGAIHNGYYYITGRNSKMGQVYKVKLSDLSVTDLNLSEEVALQDFSFYKNVNDAIPEGQFLYGIEKNGPLIKIDVNNGAVTRIGGNHSGYQFDSSYSDKNGRFFANDSNGNGFFEFDLQTGAKTLVSNSQSATFNDGANCLNAALVFNDFGDAPASYGTPKHNLANGIFMGNEIDHDVYTFDTTNADGDDMDGVDDEDGITLADGSDLNNALLAINTYNELKIKVSKDAYLNAWIDYNIDGDFDDAGEKIFSAHALTAGTHSLNIAIPNGLMLNQITYMRFRYSSTANLNPTESVNDGEVEDYAIKFKSDVLRGVFNIERTNSHLIPTIDSPERNAWYTQIVGRDFDYSVVFYEEDCSALKNVEDVTYKIELYNNDGNSSISEMAPYYGHFSSALPSSRQNITLPHDLDKLSAYKDVEFRISFASDGAGGVIKKPCPSGNYEQCFNDLATMHPVAMTAARDNFAIRPKYFYINIADNNESRKENNNNFNNPLRVASGYDYNLTIIASTDKSDKNASKNYTTTTSQSLTFNTSGSCADENNETSNINFTNGHFNNENFTYHNTGIYTLSLQDTTWSYVDMNKSTPDCKHNSGENSPDGNSLSGCDIKPISDVNLSFYPYQFELSFVMNNLPNAGHDDFIYMSDVNLSDHNVSIQLIGLITAQTKGGIPTSNFTQSCVAQNVQLRTDTNTITDNGLDIFPIKTAKHPTQAKQNINISRMARFNNEPLTASNFDHITNIATSPLNIVKDKFIDEQNGSIHLDLRYNIAKHLSLTINPIQIFFEKLVVDSPLSSSNAERLTNPNFIPSGTQDINKSRNFYFTRVASDRVNYPSIFFGNNTFIRTPLNVEIFCHKDMDFCKKLGVHDNTDKGALSKVYDGWYPSTKHNQQLDGNVTELRHSSVDVTVNPNSDIDFTNGRKSDIVNTFADCTNSGATIKVEIVPQTVLLYDSNSSNGGRPYYLISCHDKSAGELSGVGKTGNILDGNRSIQQSSKMDW